MQKKIVFASVVSEISQSKQFMTVKARLFETPKANLNGVAVTPAFLDEIVKNPNKYVALPLYADVKNLTSGKYDRLGHLYDARTGEFHSTQIGSFYKFEKEEFDGGAYCVGYARVPKRYKKTCKAIRDLYDEGSLKFSFEVLCSEYTVQDDGTQVIDASDNNYLEGMAIVSFPACEDAVALELVAEVSGIADDTKRGEKEMPGENENINAETEPKETPVATAEAEKAEENVTPNEVTAEENPAGQSTETAAQHGETTTAEAESATETAEQENAAIRQRTELEVTQSVTQYDDNTGDEVHVTDTHREVVYDTVPGEGGNIAAEAEAAETTIEAAEAVPETATISAETNAETVMPEQNLAQMIAELSEQVRQLSAQVASLQETHTIAEAIPDHGNEINPFLGEVNVQEDWRSLLEKETPSDYHDLL